MADRRVRSGALLAALMLFAVGAHAAEDRFLAQGVWSGTYRCSPMQGASGGSSGYTSSIRMEVDGNSAGIIKTSPDIQEALSGTVAADGTLRLSGTGSRRDGGSTGWRYRYDGRFTGDRFEAQGVMLSAQLETRLRDCSMSLVRSSRAAERGVQSAPAVAPTTPVEKPAAAAPPVSTASVAQGAAKRAPEAVTGDDVERTLDFSRRNESALVEGTVTRGAPHRYRISARKGQQLTAGLRSKEGARFDLYEPGSTLSMLSGGFIVQGARVAGAAGGTNLDVGIPADGTYLLLVRPAQDKAFYGLELTVTRGTSTVDGAEEWWRSRSVLIGAAVAALALVLILMRLMRRGRRRHLFRAG
ncbi:MAG TPA: hypothetical protein VD867_05090 [Burkholderiales bacterium]|nr:hypothetical protein [Burkholderiales bacterium]